MPREAKLPNGVGLTLLPPAPSLCQACAVDHRPEEPHNQQSIFYQYWFYLRNGRWPTWEDAMAHCDDKMRAWWCEQLAEHGITCNPQRAETSVQRETTEPTE